MRNVKKRECKYMLSGVCIVKYTRVKMLLLLSYEVIQRLKDQNEEWEQKGYMAN